MEPDGTELDRPIIVPKLSWLILGLVGILAAAADLLVTRTLAAFCFLPGAWLGIGPYFFPNETPHARWLRVPEVNREETDPGGGIIGAMMMLYVLGLFVLGIQLLVRAV